MNNASKITANAAHREIPLRVRLGYYLTTGRLRPTTIQVGEDPEVHRYIEWLEQMAERLIDLQTELEKNGTG